MKNIKGRVKQAVGTVTGRSDLEGEGASERADGAIQEGLGKARRRVGEAIEKLGQRVKR